MRIIEMRALARTVAREIMGVIGRGLSPLVRKNPRIIVLEGTDRYRYNENARYLFEYLSKKKEFDVYWFTHDREIQKYLVGRGLKAIRGFFEKYRILLQAGMVIGCGSAYPDHFYAVGRKTIKYCLMHGIGPKVTIYYGDDLASSLDEIKRISKFDYVNFTSEYTARRIGKIAYKLPERKIFINGYPRVDRLLHKNEMNKALTRKLMCRKVIPGFIDGARVILYTPTWRKKRIQKLPIEQMTGFKVHLLDEFLARNNAYFLYTVHLVHVGKVQSLPRGKHIHCVNYKEDKFSDINELLPESDLLLNDYSTSSTDFAILDRPQIFIMPDYEEYDRDQSFIEDYRSILPGKEATTFNQLLKLISDALQHRGADKEKRRDFLTKYYDESITQSCERHYQFIRSKLKVGS